MTDITAHPEFQSFIAAIEGAPGDDTPRLIFADWLEEHGEGQRAEFIRVQCELHNKRLDKDNLGDHLSRRAEASARGEIGHECGCALCVPHRRQWQLLDSYSTVNGITQRNQWHWLKPLRLGFHCHVEPDRGFLSRVRCSWEDWSRHGDAILADPWVPGLDEVELTTAPETPFRESLLQDDGSWKPLYEIRWPAVRSWKLPPERTAADALAEAARAFASAGTTVDELAAALRPLQNPTS